MGNDLRAWSRAGANGSVVGERDIMAKRHGYAQTYHWHSSTWTSQPCICWDLELQSTRTDHQHYGGGGEGACLLKLLLVPSMEDR